MPCAALVGIVLFFWVIALRRVVPVNEVHIVQTRKNTVSYGKGFASNTYYEWPSRIPLIGLQRVTLPVSNFSIDLPDYAAYDKERVPFLVHVMAFFRISDSNTCAQRVASFEELKEQLTAIVQGSVRTVLAAHEIDQIMLDRSRFGEAFTKEVQPQLGGWGVEAIKNIELMDIRDSKESDVIHNIMAKRTSGIERESRLVVADNTRQAEMAEIAAKREIEMSRQLAAEQVGLRTAEKDKNVGVANEQSSQQVKVQQRETAAKEMDVVQVKNVRGAEIDREVAVITAAQAKEVAIVQADAAKQVAIVSAEGNKQQTVLTAEGKLEAAKRNAEGIAVEGNAKGIGRNRDPDGAGRCADQAGREDRQRSGLPELSARHPQHRSRAGRGYGAGRGAEVRRCQSDFQCGHAGQRSVERDGSVLRRWRHRDRQHAGRSGAVAGRQEDAAEVRQ